METTERIVNSYCNFVLGWFTIQNISCEGHKEIDILAINPQGRGKNRRFHIECSVSISQVYSKISARKYDPELRKQRTQYARQRMSIGFFVKEKFGSPDIKEKLAEYGFENDNYTKVIVAWGWQDEAEVIATKKGIELWSFRDILNELKEELKDCGKHLDDDTLRTIQLIGKAEKGKS